MIEMQKVKWILLMRKLNIKHKMHKVWRSFRKYSELGIGAKRLDKFSVGNTNLTVSKLSDHTYINVCVIFITFSHFFKLCQIVLYLAEIKYLFRANVKKIEQNILNTQLV